MTLIDREPVSVFGEETGDEAPVLAELAEEELATWESRVAARERALEAAEEQLKWWSGRLRLWEGEFEALEQRTQLASKLAAQPREASTKVGRNEWRPRGSGLKYKHCQGLARRRQRRMLDISRPRGPCQRARWP